MGDVRIVVRENGPLKVTGQVSILDAEGREFEVPPGSAIVLCRCGHSSNKPFCDATHRTIGWAPVDSAARVGSSA